MMITVTITAFASTPSDGWMSGEDSCHVGLTAHSWNNTIRPCMGNATQSEITMSPGSGATNDSNGVKRPTGKLNSDVPSASATWTPPMPSQDRGSVTYRTLESR